MASKLASAMTAIDDAHAEDPNVVEIDGQNIPYELHYAQKMTKYLNQRLPAASEPLQLAIRAQHFRRWEIPRSSYPMTKAGYFSWRTMLKKRQADMARDLCVGCGYTAEESERVAALVRKEGLKEDEETQALEDVACLVFLDDQFAEFEKNHDEDKIIGILRKTWAKMTPKGREMALNMKLEGRPSELVQKALAA